MAKISELELVIRDLHTAAATIKDVADTLTEMFSNTTAEEVVAEAPVAVAHEEKQPLTYDQVSPILTDISRMSKAHSRKLRDVVRKFGATKLSEVDPQYYEAILAEAEVIRNGG